MRPIVYPAMAPALPAPLLPKLVTIIRDCLRPGIRLGILAGLVMIQTSSAAPAAGARRFQQDIQPLLARYCYDCHGDGANKGGVALDDFKSDTKLLDSTELWWKVLKNLRAGVMPPEKKPQPTAAEKEQIGDWIKTAVFRIDPHHPDPGWVTVRRLNRVEYRNTIRDLMGVDFNAEVEFPPDDTGHGFDNNGDVLTLPAMLLEKYLNAANAIVAQAVPTSAEVVAEQPRIRSTNYSRFFPRTVPGDTAGRRAYARELLGQFATKAFRRPVDRQTTDRLTALAEEVFRKPGLTFEAGVAHAMVAVLASPRFLFREEAVGPRAAGQSYPEIDEYALASRLSYFLWSSMPDDELFGLAGAKKLRANLRSQVTRMLADPRSAAWVENFAGQWLQARDIETVVIDERAVLAREEKANPEMEQWRVRLRELRAKPEASRSAAEKAEIEQLRARVGRIDRSQFEMSGDLRRSMRRETECYVEYIAREDRALVELIDSNYTFLNERLAKYYDISGVSGEKMRRVILPPDSPRGGILTAGTVLAVTSNPTRTSPVKRGLFILDNILGMPPPPPPPNIPRLEEAAREFKDHEPTLREMLAQHRLDPLCSSCHNRMDPLGLALENFNALALWRDQERGQPVDATGKLITGESFTNVRELKHILANERRRDFHRCLTEKLLTYALGRGLESYDVQTVDDIVTQIENADGRFSALLMGIVESAPFQKRREAVKMSGMAPGAPGRQLAESRFGP